MSEIDLSLLPAPKVIEELSFEEILVKKKARLLQFVPDEAKPIIAAVLELESEPLTIDLQQQAYDELILRQRINEAVAAELLALSTGSDLDNLAARMGLTRKIIQQADPEHGIDEIRESDTDFRRRVQMYPETYAAAGPVAAYMAHALAASDQVADASVVGHFPQAGNVTVYIKSHAGIPDPALLSTVSDYLNAEERRPLCDTVHVVAGSPKKMTIKYLTEFERGPDKSLVAAKQSEDLDKLLQSVAGLGASLALSKIIGALDVVGAKKVILLSPKKDIECSAGEFIQVQSIEASEIE